MVGGETKHIDSARARLMLAFVSEAFGSEVSRRWASRALGDDLFDTAGEGAEEEAAEVVGVKAMRAISSGRVHLLVEGDDELATLLVLEREL
jgi:hypothetical protein